MRTDNITTSRRRILGVAFGALAGMPMATSLIAAQSTPANTPVATPTGETTRIVSHAMGEAEVPVAPRRVVALDGPVLDACIALGIVPVGATSATPDLPWPSYLGDVTSSITNVGTIEEPTLESIVGLEPDLILSLSFRHEPIYQQLSGIAPTVLSPYSSAEWREGFMVYADALNRNDDAPAIVGAFETRVEEVRALLEPSLETRKVSVIRVLTDQLRVYQTSSFSGTVLNAVGVARPVSQQGTDDTWLELSLERLNEIDADDIFVTLWSGATDDDLRQLTESDLWRALPAVAANRVHVVPDEYWMTAIGYLAAGLILDDLATYLGPTA